MNETVWSSEFLAQECSRTFETLWDSINAATNKLDVLAQFQLRELLVPKWKQSKLLAHGIEFDARLRYVDTLHNNNGGAVGIVPSYTELDLRAGWRPTRRLELAIVGHNLLHAHHPEFGVAGPMRQEIERSVYGWITWRM